MRRRPNAARVAGEPLGCCPSWKSRVFILRNRILVRRVVSNAEMVRRTLHALACYNRQRALGRFFNQCRHRLRLRYIDRVAALDLDDHRTRALRHLPLGVGWNHLVLGRKQVPARFRFPCRFTDSAVKRVHTPSPDRTIDSLRCPSTR